MPCSFDLEHAFSGAGHSLTTAVACLFCALGFMGLGNGAVFQLVPQRFAGRMGAVTGLVGAGGGLGGFFFPVVLGWFKQYYGSFSVGFGLFAVVSALALVSLLIAQRRWVGSWLADGGRALQPAALIGVIRLDAESEQLHGDSGLRTPE